MFHVSQRGKLPKEAVDPVMEWTVYAHAKTLPRALDLFLVQRDNALKQSWLPSESPKVSIVSENLLPPQILHYAQEFLIGD